MRSTAAEPNGEARATAAGGLRQRNARRRGLGRSRLEQPAADREQLRHRPLVGGHDGAVGLAAEVERGQQRRGENAELVVARPLELQRDALDVRVAAEPPRVAGAVGVGAREADAADGCHHRRADAQQARLERGVEDVVLVAALRVEAHERVHLGVGEQAVRELPLRRGRLVDAVAPLRHEGSAPVDERGADRDRAGAVGLPREREAHSPRRLERIPGGSRVGGHPATVAAAPDRWLRVHAVQPGLELRLARGGVDAVDEQVRAHPDDAVVEVAAEEAVEAVVGADAEELGRRVVDDAVERAGVAERRVDLVADARVREAPRAARSVSIASGVPALSGPSMPYDGWPT